MVIDRTTNAGVATPTVREYISYTGIATNTLTGVLRGLGGSTAQSHSSGNLVEEVFTTTHWNDIVTGLLNVLTSGGLLDTTKVVDLTTLQTLTNKTLTSPTLGGTVAGKTVFTATVPTMVADSVSGAAVTFDMSAGNIHNLTLSHLATTTLNVTSVSTNQPFIIRLIQDSTGTNLVSWFSTIKWAGGITPTLTTTASKADTFGFICTSSGNYDGYIIGQNI